MSARDDILGAIRDRRVRAATRPAPWQTPQLPREAVAHFIDRARAAGADVHQVESLEHIPSAISESLRDRNLPAIVHLPPDPAGTTLPWESTPGLTVVRDAPGPDDSALSFAPYAIAETGTLVFPFASERPASWHFRPGLEIAILHADGILANLETVLARVKQSGALPHTINLVTGPSRTGDIEQTLELGAHGPKALAIFVVG